MFVFWGFFAILPMLVFTVVRMNYGYCLTLQSRNSMTDEMA